ncbi:MAG: ABC transporter permease [Steroidobacteraceae bacterium]
MIRRLTALTRKEFRQLLRDRSNLAMGIVLPIALILIFGYGMTFDVHDAPVAVVLEDTSPVAHELIAGISLSAYLEPVVLHDMQGAERLMRSRGVDAIVRVPADFSRRLADGEAAVQVLVHGADVSRARIVQGYLEAALAHFPVRRADSAGDAGSGAGVGVGAVVVEQRLWFNAANTSSWFLVPGLIVLITTLIGAFLTSMVVAREWERGTLESLFVTPVRPIEILLAKMLPYFAVAMIGLALCLVAAKFLFHLPMYGSLTLVVGTSVLYVLVALGIGLLISSATKNQFLASQIAIVTSFMPALMLSGFIFDLRNMPAFVAGIAQLFPATHYLDALKSLLLAGDIWPIVVGNSLLLALYAIVLLVLARVKTRKRLE